MDIKILKDMSGLMGGHYPQRVVDDGGFTYRAWSRDPGAADSAAAWHVDRTDTAGNRTHPKLYGVRSSACSFPCDDMPGLSW